MNAQPTLIPETVTVTLTREDLETYMGHSDIVHNDLASRITRRGPENAVADIVKQVLLYQGLRNRQTRKVSRRHAELALCGAISRMYAAIHHALNAPDPEDGGDADLLEMTLESGRDAGSIALELTTVLSIANASETEPGYAECFMEWSESINRTGDWLVIADEEQPSS